MVEKLKMLHGLKIVTCGGGNKPNVNQYIEGNDIVIDKIMDYYNDCGYSITNEIRNFLNETLDKLKFDVIGGLPSSKDFIRGKGAVITEIINHFNFIKNEELNDNTKYITAIEDLLSELRIDEKSLSIMANGYSPDYPGAVDLATNEKWTNPHVKVQISQVVAGKLCNLIL